MDEDMPRQRVGRAFHIHPRQPLAQVPMLGLAVWHFSDEERRYTYGTAESGVRRFLSSH